jgi:hypothetical protein
MSSKTTNSVPQQPPKQQVAILSLLFYLVEHVAAFYALWSIYINGGLFRLTSYLFVGLYILTIFSLSAGNNDNKSYRSWFESDFVQSDFES